MPADMSTPPDTHQKFTPVRYREGYDMAEVNRLLDRYEATLSGRDSLTAADVEQARFTPVRLREGYDMGQVDSHLNDVADWLRNRETGRARQQAAATQPRMSTTQAQHQVTRHLPSGVPAPAGARFTVASMTPVYVISEVDDFLDRCVAAVARDDRSVRAADVETVRFTGRRLGSGYRMEEVDAHLDLVAAVLHNLEQPAATDQADPATPAAAGHCPTCTCPPAGR